MNKRIGIFLPGRLSSHRLPNKLILPIGDTCLFEIACKKLNDLDCELKYQVNKYVLISKSDRELVHIASKFPNLKIIYRSDETTQAEGPLNFIFKELQNVPDTHLLFLNGCLLYLSEDTIKNAINYFNVSHKQCATSVKFYKNWLFDLKGKSINPINYQRLTTKEIEPLLETAHCFHIFEKDSFFKTGQMLTKELLPIIVPEEETIDVDTPSDYEYAKWRWENVSNWRLRD